MGQEQQLNKIDKAAVMRDLMQHPGINILRERIAEATGKAHSRWLLLSDEDAAKVRKETQGYELFFNLVKQVILEGDAVRKAAESQKTESPSGQPE